MQNDVLKNNIAPWQEKGRWYKITLDFSTGNAVLVSEKSDVGTGVSANTNILGANFKRICSVSYDLTFKSADSTSNYTWNFVQIHPTISTDTISLHLNLTSNLTGSIKEAILYIFGELA